MDLGTYLASRGEKLKRAGNSLVWESPFGTVSINGGLWYSFYENCGGGPASFLRRYFCEDLPSLQDLPRRDMQNRRKPNNAPQLPRLPRRSPTSDILYQYLTGVRCISRRVVDYFVDKGLIYEEAETGRVVFLGTDGEGTARHIQLRDTKTFSRLNVRGSDAHYTFHLDGTSDTLYVFEAPIDMMAFLSFYEGDPGRHSCVALCSTAPQGMERYLDGSGAIRRVYLCLDHDPAGIEGAMRLCDLCRERGVSRVYRILPRYKDFDEDLMARNGYPAIPATEHPACEKFKETIGRIPECGGNVSRENARKALLALCDGAERLAVDGKADYPLLSAAGTALGFLGPGDREQALSLLEKEYRPYRERDGFTSSLDRLRKEILCGSRETFEDRDAVTVARLCLSCLLSLDKREPVLEPAFCMKGLFYA